MSLISPGSQIKFHTVKQIISPNNDSWNTSFHAVYLSGTVQDDDGTYVTVWTNDGRTFHVPHEFITEIHDPYDSFTYFPNHTPVPPPAVSFNELLSTL